MKTKLQGQLRHLLTAFGPIAVTMGWTDEETWMQIVGVVMTLSGFAWSWWAPEKK